jgi:hypothetical protein
MGKEPFTKKDCWSGSRCRPEFSLQYHKKVGESRNRKVKQVLPGVDTRLEEGGCRERV